MSNKLGVSEYNLRSIEKEIVNLKLNLLDQYFTFNNEELNFKYLMDLHDFLFNDFYYDEDAKTRDLSKSEKNNIDLILSKISYLCINDPKNLKQILSLIEEIWHLQPFIVGNTRTLLAFLKVINEGFLLGLNIDVNQNITSNPRMFYIDNFVNQKRLTK